MARPSVSVPDEVLDKFDDTVNQMKANQELARDATRSQVIRMLMEEFIEENYTAPDGNPDRVTSN